VSSIELSKRIRINALKMVHASKSSHIGSALSIADIVAVLYENILNYQSKKIYWNDRDRFILSKGHSCSIIYAVLAEKGFIKIKDLSTYTKKFSLLMSHISHKVPGVEFSTGSLGHGLPFGVGKAIVGKQLKKTWRVFVLCSDGEMQEGANWEAMMFAAHHKLNNLVLIIDNNNLQSLDTVEKTLNLNPLEKKIEAFGWDVIRINGHDHEALRFTLEKKGKKPLCIICDTIKGKGVSFMENQVKWHYSSPDDSALYKSIKEIENA
jgi:transketolase